MTPPRSELTAGPGKAPEPIAGRAGVAQQQAIAKIAQNIHAQLRDVLLVKLPLTVNRPMAAQFRCEAPLSTTQNTRFADACGSACTPWPASAVNGLIPVDGSHKLCLLVMIGVRADRRTDAVFVNGKLAERPEDQQVATPPVETAA